MKMSEGGSIADHLNEFNTLTSELISVKVKFDDSYREKFLWLGVPQQTA